MKIRMMLAALFSFSLAISNAQNFNSLDVNDNKLIDKNEYALNAKIFDKWDENNDGKLSQDEYLNALYKIFDSNNNKVINASEWQACNRLIQTHKNGKTVDLSKWDENNDQVIDKGEFSANLAKLFKKWDSNGDNSLSKSEFYDNSFKWWDLNDDGSISETEFNQVKEITKDNKNFWDSLF